LLALKHDERIEFLTSGIPVEVQLFWTPLSRFGIGIVGFGNLNPEESLAGLLVTIQIGDLR